MVIDMLTGFTIAVPIKNKNTETICDTYRNHVMCIARSEEAVGS